MIDDELRRLVAETLRAELEPLRDEVARLVARIDATPPKLVTRAEAAKALRCSLDTIDRRIASGDLEHQRVGRRAIRVFLPAIGSPAETARMAREARRP